MIGISILIIFIFCSLSFQPIIADVPIIEQESILTAGKNETDDNCDCKKTKEWPFPFICLYLNLLFIWRGFLASELHKYSWWMLADQTWEMAKTFNCRWTNPYFDII